MIQHGETIQNSATQLLARVLGPAGANLTPEAVSYVSINVMDLQAGSETYASGQVAPSGIISEQLQTDPRWTVDSVGYNVLLALPGAAFPEGSTFQVQVVIQPVGGLAFTLLWRLEAAAVVTA